MAEISKITLPSGNTYDIKDATARQMISGGVSFIVAWDGNSVPTVANIPAGVQVTYNGTTYTGTLDADNAQTGAFYLVKSATTTPGGTADVYDEYVPVGTTGSKTWEKIGDTQVDLTDVVTGVSLSKQTDVVLGEATTFTAADSSVSFGSLSGHTDSVLGTGTTFTVTQPTITVTPTQTYLGATASGTAVGADGTANAVTGYASPTTDTFVKSVSAETNKKLVVTSITPTDGTESVSKVTKTASKLVTTSVPNVTDVGSASTWDFTLGTGADSETLIISGANSVVPTLGTAITAATGSVSSTASGADIITGVTISDKTVAKAAASAVTVATGATAANGTGDAIVTGVTIGSSASALTGLGTPSTSAFLTGVKVTAQPTITLASNDSTATGRVQVAIGISSATASGTAISASGDNVDAIVSFPAATAAAQSITVGTNDKVTALTSATDVAVTKGSV